MRIIATIYLAIALVNLGLWANTAHEHALVLTAHSLLIWSLYFFSLLSLLAYCLGKLLLPQRIWQVIFVVYLATRLYELHTRGLIAPGAGIDTNLNLISSYLWLAVPPGLAMCYLGFRSVRSTSRQGARASRKVLADLDVLHR
jgi:hypothetical protein